MKCEDYVRINKWHMITDAICLGLFSFGCWKWDWWFCFFAAGCAFNLGLHLGRLREIALRGAK